MPDQIASQPAAYRDCGRVRAPQWPDQQDRRDV